ncbi:MAG: hypothetical protein U0Q16_04360 [Bryobacteraceae bacterium]
MKPIKTVIAAVTLVVGLAINSVPSNAKPEFSKKEKTGCKTCHVAVKSKELNDTGKCYEKEKSLTTCKK